MTPMSKIPPKEWESYKEMIVDLYLEQGKKLADVIKILAKDHSFHASKSQYVLQLSKWNVGKYSSRDVWTSAAALVRKRKLEGKQTEIHIDGKKVPEKKLKKALSRPSNSQDEPMAHLSDSTFGSSGVIAYTPKSERTRGIETCDLPWFHFQRLLEKSIVSLGRPPLGDWSISGAPNPDIADFSGGQGWSDMTYAFDFMEFPVFFPEDDAAQPPVDLPGLNRATTNSTAIEQASREARLVLGKCLYQDTDPDDPSYVAKISSILKETTVEQQEGEFFKHVENLFGESSCSVAYQLLRYAAYLSSNNLLSSERTFGLVRWVAQNENVCAIERLLDNQPPTIEIFCGNLLVDAAATQETTVVNALLSKGVDPNFLGGGSHVKQTALHQAARRGNAELVNLLLKAGASPNIYSIGHSETAFELALRYNFSGRSDIPLMMIRAGASVVRSSSTEPGAPYLAIAAQRGSLELVQAMISAGARANDDTGITSSALQVALQKDDVEMVEALLAAGADVDYPLGKAYQRVINHLVTNDPYPFCWHLQTPLQLATKRNNMEMIQILIEAGADVNGCPALKYLPWLLSDSDDEQFEDDSQEEDDTYINIIASEEFILEIEDSYTSVANTPLQESVRQESAAAVRLLLRLGADVNAVGGYATALQAAAAVKEGCQMVRLLLSKGADVNSPAQGRGAMTALQAAVSAENQEAVELLLKAKADINAPPSPVGGRTALQAAIETKNISLVRFLIRAGANIHAKSAFEDGRTCLQAAAAAGSLELVELLLRSGADVNADLSRGGDKASALKVAIQNGKKTVVSRLISAGAHIEESREALGIGYLITAAIDNDEPGLAEQFFAKASPAVRSRYMGEFMASAIRIGNLRLMRLFIEAGVDIDKPVAGKLPIETAAENLLPVPMKTLLEAGANAKGGIGARAVAEAVRSCDSKLTKLRALLSAGASPKKLPGRESPLRLATERWSIKEDVVNLLLLHGADANEESGMPLQLAAAKGCIPVVDLLLQAGADVNAPAIHAHQNTALQGATRTLRTDLVKTFIAAGADINALPGPRWGMTALQGAVDSGSSAMVRFLLSKGADVNGPPSAAYGATALQKAVIKGNLVITSLLLKHGADVNAPAAKLHGRTALEAAAEHGRLDIMYLLLRNDEDPDTFNLRCRRAVKLAEASGHFVLARILGEWRISQSEAGTETK